MDELSGGQRHRVWIAMALPNRPSFCCWTSRRPFRTSATRSNLLTDLNQTRGTSVVMVLHDLNLAARYADHLIAMTQGHIHPQARRARS